MEGNNIFEETKEPAVENCSKKPMDTAALVLGIVAIVAAIISPLVSYVCGIIGLVLAIKHRKVKNTKVALILCIIGIVCGVASHVYATIMLLQVADSMLS